MNKIKFYKILKKILPNGIKRTLRNNIYIPEYDEYSMSNTNPYINDPDEIIYKDSPLKMGIIYGRMHYHKHWIAACRELKISYQIIYLEKFNWLEEVTRANLDVVLCWPDISTAEIKQMVDERLRIIETDIGLKVYPSVKEIWLYENKRVQHYWLKLYNYPIPETRVFYNEKEAEEYLEKATFPIVMKSNLGASASGVYIENNRKEAIKKVKNYLRYGYKIKSKGANRKQKGSVYLQQFLPNVKEWRMVRVGNSYFGHGKDMRGQFHSGSGKANWEVPPKKAFDLLKDITDKGQFTSMDVDIFEDQQGNLYVNELQTVFGNSIAKEQMKIDGVPGRYNWDNGNWQFESGDFCKNHLCNLRLQYIISQFTHNVNT